MQREANTARLAEVEKKLHAAVQEAATTGQHMHARVQAMVEDAERVEEKAQQREKELKKRIDQQAIKIIGLVRALSFNLHKILIVFWRKKQSDSNDS